jgi:hypothetical protein
MKSDPKFLQCFASLGESFTASPELVEVLEEFTCTLYGDTSKDILMQAGTSRSVRQHPKRACRHVKMRCYSILRDVPIKLPYTTGHFNRP